MSYHDMNYQLQDMVSAYLGANLATYASGVAAGLKRVKGGDFGDRDGAHIYIVCPEITDNTIVNAAFVTSVIVGVATLKETTLTTHRGYTKAVLDLMMDTDLPAYLSAVATGALRVTQVMPGMKTRIGVANESQRFTEIELNLRVHMV
jgi:hypothetical protein